MRPSAARPGDSPAAPADGVGLGVDARPEGDGIAADAMPVEDVDGAEGSPEQAATATTTPSSAERPRLSQYVDGGVDRIAMTFPPRCSGDSGAETAVSMLAAGDCDEAGNH